MCRKQKSISVVKNEEQSFTLQKSAESFTVQQKVLLHSRKLYYATKSYTAQQKAILRSRRFYCTVGSFTAMQKVLLRNRRFYCTTESFTAQQKSWSCGRNQRKVPSVAKAEDKLTLQRLPLEFGLIVCAQTGSGRMVLWSPFRQALGITSFLEKSLD